MSNDDGVRTIVPSMQIPQAILPSKIDSSIRTISLTTTNWSERIRRYFLTNHGRINLTSFSFTLVSVILQHVMGTCHHNISDGVNIVKWHVFTPPCSLMKFIQ
jgi:hypothetical protein